MNIEEYVKMISDIIKIEKEQGLVLSETMRIAILQEVAKDLRTQEINKKPDGNIITDKQKNYLIAHDYPRNDVEKMTRDDASKIISEIIKKSS
jgi:hypothetical protein